MRTFIAVELSNEIKNKIFEISTELGSSRPEVKWVEKENLHITLAFIGRIEENATSKLIKLVESSFNHSGSFEIEIKGAGYFPEGASLPRVIWVGVAEGGDGLCKLADEMHETLSKAGYKLEDRKFHPHVTIGRIRGKYGTNTLIKGVDKFKEIEIGKFFIGKVSIMKSTLTRNGPIYEIIKEVFL